MTITSVAAGQIILADHYNALVPITVSKSSNTARTSTTSETADPHLVLPMRVGTFDVKGVLYVSSAANAAGDFKYAWGWTNSMTVSMGGVGLNNSLASGSSTDAEMVWQATDSASPTATNPYGVSTAGVNIMVEARVVVATAGNLSLLWAQFSSNANATSLLSGSYITAFPVA